MSTTLLRAAAVVAFLLPAAAQAQMADQSVTAEIQAVVVSADPDTREVMLEDPETGETQLIVAGPEVKNFDQIEAGDTVRAQVTLGLTARMALPGENDSAAALEGRAEEGTKPGAVGAIAVTRVLELLEYDPETFVAVLRDQDGVTRSIFVQADVGREFAAGLTAGDRVAVTFSETMAIGIVEE